MDDFCTCEYSINTYFMLLLYIVVLVLKPLSAEVKATLTTKPGKDPNIPQADVNIEVDKVAVQVDKLQVRNLS